MLGVPRAPELEGAEAGRGEAAGGQKRGRPPGAGPLADRLRPYVEAGAEWIIVGPINSSDPENAPVLAEVRTLLT